MDICATVFSQIGVSVPTFWMGILLVIVFSLNLSLLPPSGYTPITEDPADWFAHIMLQWCCPKPDSVFGFQKVLKHYYLQGLHQVVVNADIYINGDVYDSLTDHQKKALEVAANASLSKAMSYRIYENGKALKDLTENHGVILHDTPADYFPAYMNAARASLEKNAAENEFFAEVWQSQKDFAAIAVPFWAGAQASNASLGKAFADSVK